MEEINKDTVRSETTNQRILRDIRAIQADAKLVEVHCIELEKIVLMTMIDEENHLEK